MSFRKFKTCHRKKNETWTLSTWKPGLLSKSTEKMYKQQKWACYSPWREEECKTMPSQKQRFPKIGKNVFTGTSCSNICILSALGRNISPISILKQRFAEVSRTFILKMLYPGFLGFFFFMEFKKSFQYNFKTNYICAEGFTQQTKDSLGLWFLTELPIPCKRKYTVKDWK